MTITGVVAAGGRVVIAGTTPSSSTGPLVAAVAASVGGAVILVASARSAGLGGSPGAVQLAVALQTVAVVSLLGAAMLCLSHRRIDGRAPAAYIATALVVYAVVAEPLASLLSPAASVAGSTVVDETVRAVVTLVASVLVWAALRRGVGRAASRRALAVRVALVVSLGAVAVIAVDRTVAAAGPRTDPRLAELVLDSLALTTWLALAAVAWRHRRSVRWATRIIPLAVGLAASRALDAAAGDEHGSAWHLGSVLLAACLAVLVLVCAMGGLIEAIDSARRRADRTSQALDRAADGVLARDAWREELSHDAANAITGLRAALSTMTRYEDRLDLAAARRLREAAIAEVAHLEHLIARSAEDQPVVFDVAEVISPIIETRRAGGLDIDVDAGATGPEDSPGEGLAQGRPGDLATVLHNLLINVGVHAPGSRVHVSVSRGPDQVGVAVRDDGPGIDKADHDRVFERGVRGAASASTGLGLYVARELMREQGGELALVQTETGCLFVATLPAASTPLSSFRPRTPVAPVRPRQPLRPRRPADGDGRARSTTPVVGGSPAAPAHRVTV